jgi:hypothetical protein
MGTCRQEHTSSSTPDWLRPTLCLALLILMTAGAFWGLPASQQFHITEQYLFWAETDASVRLGILLPRSNVNQVVRQADVSWPGLVSWEHTDSLDVLKLTADVKAFADLEASVEYDVVLYQNRRSWDGPVYEFQLKPQPYIESDCSTIVRRASMIASEAQRDDAYQIYKFTTEYISWSETAEECGESSALDAYEARASTCSGYANLMVALCRASGIPSQRMSGIILPDHFPFWPTQVEAWEHPGEAHGWVEFYAENRWQTADPTCASRTWRWFQFGRSDGHHLSYGEVESEIASYHEMYLWAIRQGAIIGQRLAALKFASAAEPAKVSVIPMVTVKKVWDGRIFNALIAWSITIIPIVSLSRKQGTRRFALSDLMSFRGETEIQAGHLSGDMGTKPGDRKGVV